MESAVSFTPLRPAGFVNFAGRGGARPAFCGAGRGSLFFRGAGWGRATIPVLYTSPVLCICPQPHLYVFAPPDQYFITLFLLHLDAYQRWID